MATLTELKAKYQLDRAKYEPNPHCKFCKGTGEKPLKRTRKNIITGEEQPEPRTHTFCICLFVEHDASDEIGDMLGHFASQKLREMGQ